MKFLRTISTARLLALIAGLVVAIAIPLALLVPVMNCWLTSVPFRLARPIVVADPSCLKLVQ